MAPRNGGVTNEAVTSAARCARQRHVGARHQPAHRRRDHAADQARRSVARMIVVISGSSERRDR